MRIEFNADKVFGIITMVVGTATVIYGIYNLIQLDAVIRALPHP